MQFQCVRRSIEITYLPSDARVDGDGDILGDLGGGIGLLLCRLDGESNLSLLPFKEDTDSFLDTMSINSADGCLL